MTRTRYRIFETDLPYFMTCTVVGWLPVFTRPEAVEILLESWRHLQKQREWELFGYVILENHVHLIVSSPELPRVMQRFKSYTARRLLDLLQRRAACTLLRQLRTHKLRHKTQCRYQVWQEGSEPKQVQNEAMMWQKLEYIHNNPVVRGYVDDPLHWRYSSARDYAGRPGPIDVVTDWI